MLSGDRILDLPANSRRVALIRRSASKLVLRQELRSRVRLWGWRRHSVIGGGYSCHIAYRWAAQLEIDHRQADGGRLDGVFLSLDLLVRQGHSGQNDGAKAGNPDHVATVLARTVLTDTTHQSAFQRLPVLLAACYGREKPI